MTDTRVRRQLDAAKALRRAGRLLLSGALAQGLALGLLTAEVSAFSFDDVVARASKLAHAAYQKPGNSLPKSLKALNYDQYRDIRFRPERALWLNAKLPFE